MKAIRQGDVLLVRVPALPKGARRRREAVACIPGENGHSHMLTGAALFEHHGRAFASVAAGATAVLDHDEHPAVSVAEGVWEIRTPRTFDWPQFVPMPEEVPVERTVAAPRRDERSVPYAD